MTSQIITQLNPDVPPTGSDLGIVNAARKSFGRRSEWNWSKELEGGTGDGRTLKDKDKRLLEFLARGMTADDFDEFCDRNFWWNFLSDDPEDEQLKSEAIDALWQWRNTPTHDTPFNHGFFSFEVKAPIFVARHLVKHEYLIMSEYSRRYITDDLEFYTPKVWRKAAADVKQGSSDEAVTYVNQGCGHSGCCPPDGTLAVPVNELVEDANEVSMDTYETLIAAGVAPEQARMVLPQSLMTSWTWSGSFGAFANMCKLRLSSDTQAETRVVAEAVYEELKKQFPVAAPLLVEGVI
jgi:thymidylate synthase (FAD)